MCDKRNMFCFMCGLFVDKSHRTELKKSKVLVEAFNEVFKQKYVESRWYEPDVICFTCSTHLKLWKNGKSDRNRFPYSAPMIWHRQMYHKEDDCYFCQTNTVGHHFKTRNSIQYPNVTTVSEPIPADHVNTNLQNDAESIDLLETVGVDSEDTYNTEKDKPFIPRNVANTERHLVSEADFHDLVRDLGLSIRQTEVLGSRLKQWNLVDDEFKISTARQRDLSRFEEVFATDPVDNKLVYCKDVDGLFFCLNHEHQLEDWRLFLDGSCKSLKAVLLHNENQLPSVPIAYAKDMKESYETMQKILQAINYNKYQWKIVSDLKVLTILLGLQGGYTKNPCYFCEWDSRAAENHYSRRDWPPRKSIVGQKNMINLPLVETKNIILPPLHLKLGYMKQFVKRLDPAGKAFSYLKSLFPKLSDAKIKEGVFVGPQIRKVMKDENFVKTLKPVEKRAWKSFVALCENFLGNNRSENYKKVVDDFLTAYGKMGCRMSIKIHFLHSHLDFFPVNLGQFSDEQGERFHQEMLVIEKRFEGKSEIRMMANFCWSLQRDTSDLTYKRSRSSKHF